MKWCSATHTSSNPASSAATAAATVASSTVPWSWPGYCGASRNTPNLTAAHTSRYKRARSYSGTSTTHTGPGVKVSGDPSGRVNVVIASGAGRDQVPSNARPSRSTTTLPTPTVAAKGEGDPEASRIGVSRSATRCSTTVAAPGRGPEAEVSGAPSIEITHLASAGIHCTPMSVAW